MDVTNTLQNQIAQSQINTAQSNQRRPAFELNAPQPKAAANSYAQSNNSFQRAPSNLPTLANIASAQAPSYTSRGQLVDFEA